MTTPLSPADIERLESLFEQAADLPVAEHAAFVERECGDNAVLRDELSRLLAGLAGEDVLGQLMPGAPLPSGTRIGPYTLLERIGQGGMGEVYAAEQTVPVERRVALKLIKLGMDTHQVIARFEAERQALGMMDHPHIAQVFDAGVTDSGRPYFVMELVKGIPITDYCEQQFLSTERRLSLFASVCQAVQHAHMKGVIHRDLKPTNVMVSLRDGEPVVKLIDFGIAKATERHQAERTLFTEYGQVLGTPEYMAPEQADSSGVDIDTRADVYSLGVLLYELLTGTRPFELKTLRRRGLDEVLRIIREEEPQMPSARVSAAGKRVSASAEHRKVAVKTLSRVLAGDLDWIAMKALEKDRSRRYDTASSLAKDIGRYLRDEPVDASPPTATYRLRKYLKRHAVGVSTGSAVLLALLIGLVLAWSGYLEARDQQLLAVRSEEDAKDSLARSLYEQGRAVRLAGGMGQRYRTLELLRKSAQLVKRARADIDDPRAAGAATPSELPTLADLRSEALESLLLEDARQPEQIDAPRSVDGDYPKNQRLSAGSRFLLEWDRDHYDPDSRKPEQESPKQVRVFDLDRNEEVRSLELSLFEGETLAALGPRGQRLVTKRRERGFQLWDLATGLSIRSLSTPDRYSELYGRPVTTSSSGGCFSPSGRYFACSTINGVGLWDLENAGHPVWLESPATESESNWGTHQGVTFSRDERFLAHSSGRRVTVFDPSDGELLSARECAHGLRQPALFTAEDRLMVQTVQGIRDEVQIWDPMEDVVVLQFPTQGQSSICPSAISPDGEFAAFAHTSTGVLVHRLSDGNRAFRCDGDIGVGWLRWQPERPRIHAGRGGRMQSWELSLSPRVRSVLSPYKEYDVTKFNSGVGSLAFSPDGRWIVVRDKQIESEVILLEATTGEHLYSWPDYDWGGRLLFSSEGDRVASVDAMRATVWETGSGRDVTLTHGKIRAAAFNPEGQLLVGTMERTAVGVRDAWAIHLRDTQSTEPIRVIDVPSRRTRAELSHDGRFLVTYDQNGSTCDISVHEVPTGAVSKPFSRASSIPEKVSYLNAGNAADLMISTHADRVVAWSLPDGRIDWQIPTTAHTYGQTVLSPDGDLVLLSLRVDSRSLPESFLWSLQRGERLLTLPGQPLPTAFSPDGAHLATVNNGLIEIYHLDELRAELEALDLGW